MPDNSAGSPPRVSDRYEIKEAPIGRGGMGVVYKAYDNKTRRFVALKTILGEVDPGALDLFEREWNVLARISHPNIVDILDTGDYPENGHRKPFFVMPLLPGATLEKLIKSGSQRLTVERTIEIMCQACRGLQAAHEQGLVHRDIKPSNIFVLDDDTVKIIDFGVVHLADARTVTGMKGTPLYMSPEQIEGKTATASSDIFSLGVVCYEALTGRKPFGRRNESEMFEAIRSHIPPPASDINPAVNQLVSRTVHKAIAKQPWHRFSTARELSETLQRALRNEHIERFDRAKIQPRIDRIKKAQAEGDYQFAIEILTELESEGHIDPDMSVLRVQLDHAIRTKTIRQLLDSARTRMEEDEYPLALQKIQDVLNLDPTNLDATTLRGQIERQRSEKQSENWFRLVAQHLDNQDYRQARQALEEILKINSADARARELLSRVERSEHELSKAREEKQKLYDAALHSYRDGEISTALSKLERILEINRSGPKSTTPHRDQQYQSLYNQIRSEREAARNLYGEGRKQLGDNNFAKTLEICEQFLQKHPGDPLFQALKLEAEEAQRQEQSAAIAEFSRRIDSEPDLDKKFNIITEAVEKYPAEAQFKSSLKLIKDRRDLVNSIVARARQYEERGQLNDASAQWDILRNIYPRYPALDFEMQRLARRRDEQVTQEAKARWVDRIDRQFGAGDYAKAREDVRQALAEFPDDQELRELDSLAERALRRNAEAAALLKEGQQQIAANYFDAGIEILRRAERLDERNQVARAALLGALLQRARDLMSSDWHAAEPLVQEVLQLEPTDPVARSLTSLIGDYKRQEAVSRFLMEARNLQAAGDLDAALAKIEHGLKAFPNESRLGQLQHTLRGTLQESRKQEPAPAPAPDARSDATMLFDPATLPAPKKPAAPQNPVAPSSPKAVPAPSKPVAPEFAAPKPQPPEPPVIPPHKPVEKTSWPIDKSADKALAPVPLLGGVIAAALIILAGALFWMLHRPPPPGPGPSRHVQVPVTLRANVPVARYRIDGKPVDATEMKFEPGSSHQAEAEADGYISQTRPITVPSNSTTPINIAFDLHPALAGLHIYSDIRPGKLVLDQTSPLDLQDGSLTKDDLQPGPHRISILDSAKRDVFDFSFDVKPRELSTLSAPPKGSVAGLVISSLGSNAIVYGSANLKGGVEGQPTQVIPAAGLKLTLPPQGSLNFLVDDGKGKTRPVAIAFSPLPALNVSLSGAVERIPVLVNANVPDAMVLIDGNDYKPLVNGTRTLPLKPGKHRIGLRADDYEPVDEQMVELKSGAPAPPPLSFNLKRVAHMAWLIVESAPPDTELVIDGNSAGTITPGAFKKEVSPAHHTVVLKKQNYVDYTQHHQFGAGEIVTINAAEMKPYGKLTVKVSPDAARIVYRRSGGDEDLALENNQSHSLPPGDYTVSASAEGYLPDSQNLTILPGKDAPFVATLNPTKVVVKQVLPAEFFENGRAWNFTDANGWWTYPEKGFSFTRKSEGTMNFTLPKDPKAFLKEKLKKYEIVADYRDEQNKILYTLDPHHLTKKVFVENKEQKDQRSDSPLSASDNYRLTVQITPEMITFRVNGVTDTTKRPDAHGKFGFVNEVVLAPR